MAELNGADRAIQKLRNMIGSQTPKATASPLMSGPPLNEMPDNKGESPSSSWTLPELDFGWSSATPCQEREVDVLIEVRVRTFGKPDQVTKEVMLTVAREVGLHTHNSMLRLPGGKWHRWDKFGDDMGHHPGHDEPLVPVEGG